MRNISTFLDWFRSHDPFDGSVLQLYSLARLLAASEGGGINRDITGTVGTEIQQSLDNVIARHATINMR